MTSNTTAVSTIYASSLITPTLKNVSKAQKAATKVYSYTRFSTAEQRKGRGQKRQTGLADGWCKANGYTLEQAYSDLGVSAFKSKHATHGDLSRFLVVVQNGTIRPGSVLLVESLDRLSRDNINLAVQLLLGIINSGVIVVTMIDNAVYRADAEPMTLMAQLMLSVAIFMRANDESRMKSARKGDSWQGKREGALKGEYHGGKTPRWIKVVGGKYQVIEAEAKVIRDIFTDYTHKGFGLNRLNQKYGIPMPTIGYWIDNPAVMGTLIMSQKGVKIEVAGAGGSWSGSGAREPQTGEGAKLRSGSEAS